MSRRLTPDSQNLDTIPTLDDLDRAPELAILAALDHTLELATAALVCAHPELCDPERPYWISSPTRSLTLAKTLNAPTRARRRDAQISTFSRDRQHAYPRRERSWASGCWSAVEQRA